MNTAPYLVYFDYFATGEGRTEIIALVHAKSRKQAVQEVLINHLVHDKNDKDALAYFSCGAEALNLSVAKNHEKAMIWLRRVFTENFADFIIRAKKKHALREFYMKLYVNYS